MFGIADMFFPMLNESRVQEVLIMTLALMLASNGVAKFANELNAVCSRLMQNGRTGFDQNPSVSSRRFAQLFYTENGYLHDLWPPPSQSAASC